VAAGAAEFSSTTAALVASAAAAFIAASTVGAGEVFASQEGALTLTSRGVIGFA